MAWPAKVLEKLLRWRKGGGGSCGYQPDQEMIDEVNNSDIMIDFRKRVVEKGIDEAISGVLATVESPEARQQYRRMILMYQQAKVASFQCKPVKTFECLFFQYTKKNISCEPHLLLFYNNARAKKFPNTGT
jgi:hypothetical protein